MDNLNEPKNIIGMADILADDDEEDINIEEIEKSITKGIDFSERENEPVDLVNEYDKELEQLSRQFNVSSYDSDKNKKNNLLDWTPENDNIPSPTEKSYDTHDKLSIYDNDTKIDSENESDNETENVYSNKSGSYSEWNSSKPNDAQLYRMTNEERKQSHINKVLGDLDNVEGGNKFIQEEEEEDETARIMEQVDLLRTNLEAEGVNLERIPEIDSTTSRKEAKSILKILQIKNDRLRYCDMFEEGILAAAYGLETIFDGRKEWFGAKIDLVGWPETVKVKLRRMRYDTSTFVSTVMSGYSVGSGWRIIMELLPSLFLYSRDRRLRTNDNLISDASYKDAIRDLQDN